MTSEINPATPSKPRPGMCLGTGRGHWWCVTQAVLIILAMCLITISVSATQAVDLPSPLDGPGRPELKKSQTKRIEKAWKRFEDGDLSGARKALRKAMNNPAGRLLALQIDLTADPEPPVDALTEFCVSHGDYASAWVTLTSARELMGDEAGALQSARRVSELWPSSRWAGKAAALEQEWITARIDQARGQLELGNAREAIELVDSAIELDPDNRTGHMVRAMSLLDLGEDQSAEAELMTLADDPEARMLLAVLAEDRGDLSSAMRYYESVPVGMAGRDESLARVKLEWRRQNLPSYVQEALSSDELTRAGLAAVLVGLVPEAHALAGGQVPLLSDIVETPSRREILTVARLGLMDVDTLQHQFYPNRAVNPSEARKAIDLLCLLLEVAPPNWCSEAEVIPSDCVEIHAPVGGREVADVIIRTTHGEDR